MAMTLSRRMMLAGMIASAATSDALAEAPLLSRRPVARSVGPDVARQMIVRAGLSGAVGLVIADVATGAVLESVHADLPQPPASVSKAVTACYAIEALGAQYQFETRLFADGPIRDGILDGNLILAGGGDPNLLTDDLADLAALLKAAGLTEVRGDFLVWGNALPNVDQIDGTQLAHLGYNPTVAGLNLNFNRVHFAWQRAGNDFTTVLDARSDKYRPSVTSARMQIVDRGAPVFTYHAGDGVDEWTVARQALNAAGSRWLPVRHPALYAGEVFAIFARAQGIVLKPARAVAALPAGRVLARNQSAPLVEMMRGMLRYSTNITAEAAGLSATMAVTGQRRGLQTSALGMARWAQRRAGVAPYFVDHSGLADTSRITASDMVRLLTADGTQALLHPLLKEIPLVDRGGRAIAGSEGALHAKTGTLNFVSCLAGYLRTAGGRDLAFGFFAADLEARAQGKLLGDEKPRGAGPWNAKAKRLQQQILQHWAASGA
nr:D-alanyl-D-alanine carboxypeptidase/D-alanyl-D-alanine-endopeptidase [Yoonia sp.]